VTLALASACRRCGSQPDFTGGVQGAASARVAVRHRSRRRGGQRLPADRIRLMCLVVSARCGGRRSPAAHQPLGACMLAPHERAGRRSSRHRRGPDKLTAFGSRPSSPVSVGRCWPTSRRWPARTSTGTGRVRVLRDGLRRRRHLGLGGLLAGVIAAAASVSCCDPSHLRNRGLVGRDHRPAPGHPGHLQPGGNRRGHPSRRRTDQPPLAGAAATRPAAGQWLPKWSPKWLSKWRRTRTAPAVRADTAPALEVTGVGVRYGGWWQSRTSRSACHRVHRRRHGPNGAARPRSSTP